MIGKEEISYNSSMKGALSWNRRNGVSGNIVLNVKDILDFHHPWDLGFETNLYLSPEVRKAKYCLGYM